MTQSVNPLRQYFRQPVLYIQLPSHGQFWPAGCLDMPPNNELPVLPMTAFDEITYRTPDALFNGDAVINVIQSCLPNIKNAWKMPMVDLNTILTAIRIASHGNEIELTSSCPNCNAENTYGVDLRDAIAQLQAPNFNVTVKHGDIEVYFKPMSYEDQNAINLAQFEQQRILQQLPNLETTEEERNQRLNDALLAITKITLQAVAFSINSIKTPQALVVEPEFIIEFLQNCGGKLFTQIRDHAVSLRTADELKPIAIDCPECQHHYEQTFVLDTALFFDNAS